MTEGKCHICRNVLCQGSYLISCLLEWRRRSLCLTVCLKFGWHERYYSTEWYLCSIVSLLFYAKCLWFSRTRSRCWASSASTPAGDTEAQKLYFWHTPAFYLTFCLFISELTNSEFGVAAWPWGRRSCSCPSQSSKNHLDRNSELNTD